MIDNRPGAGGNIAAEIVAKSNPDGYTTLLGNNGILSINVSLYEKPGFHPLKDFAPVVLAASQPNIVAVHPSVPAKSIKEPRDLTDLIKKEIPVWAKVIKESGAKAD